MKPICFDDSYRKDLLLVCYFECPNTTNDHVEFWPCQLYLTDVFLFEYYWIWEFWTCFLFLKHTAIVESVNGVCIWIKFLWLSLLTWVVDRHHTLNERTAHCKFDCIDLFPWYLCFWDGNPTLKGFLIKTYKTYSYALKLVLGRYWKYLKDLNKSLRLYNNCSFRRSYNKKPHILWNGQNT